MRGLIFGSNFINSIAVSVFNSNNSVSNHVVNTALSSNITEPVNTTLNTNPSANTLENHNRNKRSVDDMDNPLKEIEFLSDRESKKIFEAYQVREDIDDQLVEEVEVKNKKFNGNGVIFTKREKFAGKTDYLFILVDNRKYP